MTFLHPLGCWLFGRAPRPPALVLTVLLPRLFPCWCVLYPCSQLKQMNMEIHTVPSASKTKYKEKIASFKLRVDAAKKTLLFSGSASAAAAAGGANGGMYAKQQSMEEKQAASLEVLKKSRQQLAETEATGINTVNELEKQNNQIKKTRVNTQEINADLSHSNKLLNKMSQWWRG